MTKLTKALLLSTTMLLPALTVPAQQRRLQPESVPLNWTSGPYGYDGSGNIVSIGPGSFEKIDVHVYDAFGRLVSTSAGTASHTNTQSITYDRHGNITRLDTTSAPGTQSSVTETVTPLVNDATNRLRDNASACGGTICPTGTYDEAGNQLTSGGGVTYGYDVLGMMKEASSASGRERYIYDSNGERIATVHLTSGVQAAVVSRDVTVRRSDGKVVRQFIDQLVGGAHTWTWQKDYVYRGSLLLAAVVPNGTGETRQHFHLDHLGSPRLITDDRGVRLAFHTYLPFGEEAPGSDYDTEAMKFTGHERSATSSIAAGLDYMHARFYAAGVGRFLSMDPYLDVEHALSQPNGWNRYSYVRNNPVGFTDPTGKYLVDCAAGDQACQDAATEFETQRLTDLHSKQAEVRAAAAAYGDPNDDNHVVVSFKALADVQADAKTTNPNVASFVTHTVNLGTGEYTVKAEFATILKGADMAQKAAHEGVHVQTRSAFLGSFDPQTKRFNAALNVTVFEDEFRAFSVGSEVKAYSAFKSGPKGFMQLDQHIRKSYKDWADRLFPSADYPQH